VALVFQSGPYPGRTERILETLKRYGLQADFLISGSSCRAHPELVRRLAAEHQVLGSCGMDRKALDRMPINDAELQMTEGNDAVQTAAGVESTIFGFPLAASSPDLIDFAEQKKWTILVSKLGFVLGNGILTVDSRDWQLMDPSALYDHVVANLERGSRLPASDTPQAHEAGQILLFHDEYEATVQALPSIINEILARGLKPVVVK
jgi:peptidoglycan/xylan/chitin deacetylase (PgdA/CDA1 family)